MDGSTILDFREIVIRVVPVLLIYAIASHPSTLYALFERRFFFSDNGFPLKHIPTHTPKWLSRQMMRHPSVNVLAYTAFILTAYCTRICGILYTVVAIIIACKALFHPLSSTASDCFISLTVIVFCLPSLLCFLFQVIDSFFVVVYHLRNSPIWHKSGTKNNSKSL